MIRKLLKANNTVLIKYPVNIALIASVFFVPTMSASADKQAIELLNRMNHAVHRLNYTGTLAYLKDNSLSSLHITHKIENGVEIERVVRLNEQGNEVSRELQNFSFASARTIRPEMEKVYSFDIGRENRIANIPCRIITARPKDRERYLQKYCIDPVTGMLLDYILVGKSHLPVEQFMFTSIDISIPKIATVDETAPIDQNSCVDAPCPDKPMAIKVDGVATTAIIGQGLAANNDNTIVISGPVEKASQKSAVNLDDGWVMEPIPIGFEISQAPSMKPVKAVQKTEQETVADTKHYIISDGLSSVSVFVSPFTDESDFGAVKINSGALNVVSKRKGNEVITVVGEVPEETLRNIVNNLRKKK